MSLGDKLRERGRDARTILGGLAVLLLLSAGAFYVVLRSRDLPTFLVNNRVVLFALWYVDVVLILAILFVLLRNLFKLAVERHHRILGSKFKTKLVAAFVGLSLIPGLLLFGIASELLEGSIERWFATPVREVLEQGDAVAEALIDQVAGDAERDARRALAAVAGADLDDLAGRPEVTRRLRQALADGSASMIALYDGTEFVTAVVDAQSLAVDLPETPRDLLRAALAEGSARRRLAARDAPGRLVATAVAAAGEAPDRPVVVAAIFLDPRVAEQTDRLSAAYLGYRQLEAQREDLKASHLLTFLMVTLLILLASSWVGLYLARRVTVPIQALAEGTRRVGLGDLDHRVDVPAGDELGVLVDSFNRMTGDLRTSREALAQSHRETVAANERLAAERALMAAVLANVAAGVVSIDPDGGVLTCNAAALQMLRLGEGEIVGQPLAVALGDPERAKLAELAAGPPGDPAAGVAREIHLVLGGEWKTFEVKVTPLAGGDGEAAGRVLVIEDLTELIKAQTLAAWNEAARRIAHEIKNPLTPIKLSAERLLRLWRQGDPNLGAAIEEGADLITREVESMQGMVDEFSRYARMPRPRPASVDLARMIEETTHLYRDLKPGVEVEGRVAPAAAEAWIDAEQVKRVLINLLDNALEATEPPGRVTVAADRHDGRLRFRVADTGRGIPAGAREKLFLPHFSTKGRGTGLGLAIVHRIVTDHHGTIRFEENRPQGTVFTIELPG